jgi:hypothetical protein
MASISKNAAKAMAVVLVIFDIDMVSGIDPYQIFNSIQDNFINTRALSFLRND